VALITHHPPSPPPPPGLELVTPGTNPQKIGQSSAILRYVAKLSPSSNLYGPGDRFTKAQVDQWLDFVWAELDVPSAALTLAPEGDVKKAIQADIAKSLSIVDAHLVQHTYLACNFITVADISLACSIRAAGPVSSSTPNLSRWFNTIANHPKIAPLFGGGSAAGAGANSGNGAALVDLGLQLSGVPPPRAPPHYQRGRRRVEGVGEAAV
jgi:glutathione S-transferase